MTALLKVIRGNWRQNYRHHGGLPALFRCLLGSAGIYATRPRATFSGEAPLCEALTFSVVPWLTVLWADLLARRLPAADMRGGGWRIVIGDGSGGLRRRHRAALPAAAQVIPCLNQRHGHKLDLFLARVCRAPYVLIADDDVFWLSDAPWRFALRELEDDPELAVVSLWPRERTDRFADGSEGPLMGSHCLVVRRELFLREGLSFEAIAPPVIEAGEWFRDTGDEAHHQLLARGYRVLVAPPEQRAGLAGLDSLSASTLRLQKYLPSELPTALDLPIKEDNALRAVLAARALAGLVSEMGLDRDNPEWLAARRLEAAERTLRHRVPETRQKAVGEEVTGAVTRIRDSLSASGDARQEI